MSSRSLSSSVSTPAFAGDASLAYRGEFTERQVELLLGWSERLLSERNWSLTQHKRGMRCTIELLQNLVRHSGKGGFELRFGENGAMKLTSFNVVSQDQKEHIQHALEQAKAPKLAELRDSRLEKLVHGQRTNAGGAGLGFMDLRACSEDHIHGEFIPFKDKHATFVLTVTIHPSAKRDARLDH
ncbi:MAG: DUF6272 family protein [Flavobacteriales bacterium]